MKKKPTVAIVYGGKSAEYEVSLQTAFSVINAIDKEKYNVLPVHITNNGEWLEGSTVTGKLTDVKQLMLEDGKEKGEKISAGGWLTPAVAAEENENDKPDIVFPLLHGPNGEDGTVQGLLEILGIAYVGSGVAGSAAGMDKIMMKDIFKAHGLPQADYMRIDRHEWERDRSGFIRSAAETIGFPCFVKPANNGSSIGINKSHDENEFVGHVETAFQYDQKVIVEAAIVGREVEIGVIGNEDLEFSVPGEIKPNKEFYDYEAKYKDGDTTLIIPADITDEQLKTIRSIAGTAFKILNLSGLARVDFFIREADGQVLINEVNTMPGFTPFSMFPLLWKHTGLEYPDLIDRLIQLGIERRQARESIRYRLE